MKKILQENKKAIFFLLRFLLVFGTLSLVQGYWISSFGDKADSFSWMVGRHMQWILGSENLQLEQFTGMPVITVIYHGTPEISLFEGCNGLAVMILFFAFIFAFKGEWKDLLWFTPVGLVAIHLCNLARLILLLVLAGNDSPLFHYMHKYFLTLIIYGFVFLLWVWWVRLVQKRQKSHAAA